ncbi:MAG: anti-sigma factor [Chthoniobacterales bacterium]
MIEEPDEEQAALHALEMLEGEERSAFAARLAGDPQLAEAVDQFRETAAKLAEMVPARDLPASLEGRILAEIRSRREVIALPPARALAWLPWAIAACLVLGCAFLLRDRNQLHDQLAVLQRRDTISRYQIASLSSQLESVPKGNAVAVWDAEKQEGVLKVLDVPPAGRDRDYQLWLVDPAYGQPVDAGVFKVEKDGATKFTFKPKAPVKSINAFAVSLERKGGVPKAEGPMVLVGK